MSAPGYVYALINPTLNGIVKVGMTTKDPTERAKELSSATGVPTPFTVAYQIYVADCCDAEKFVHTYLEESGYRVAGNREFFEVPLNIVIDAMLAAKNKMQSSLNESFFTNDDFNEPDGIAEQLYEQAEGYLEGAGDVLQNHEKALVYFKKAAKLGSPDAFWQLGRMHQAGRGCKQNVDTALKYYEKSAIKGRSDCWAIMGDIYAYVGTPHGVQNIANAKKCYQNFFNSEMFNCRELADLNAIHSGVYIKDVYEVNEMAKAGILIDQSHIGMPIEHLDKLKTIKKEILSYLESVIDSWRNRDREMVKRWSLILDYARNALC